MSHAKTPKRDCRRNISKLALNVILRDQIGIFRDLIRYHIGPPWLVSKRANKQQGGLGRTGRHARKARDLEVSVQICTELCRTVDFCPDLCRSGGNENALCVANPSGLSGSPRLSCRSPCWEVRVQFLDFQAFQKMERVAFFRVPKISRTWRAP